MILIRRKRTLQSQLTCQHREIRSRWEDPFSAVSTPVLASIESCASTFLRRIFKQEGQLFLGFVIFVPYGDFAGGWRILLRKGVCAVRALSSALNFLE